MTFPRANGRELIPIPLVPFITGDSLSVDLLIYKLAAGGLELSNQLGAHQRSGNGNSRLRAIGKLKRWCSITEMKASQHTILPRS